MFVEQNFLEQKISDVNIENDKESVSSPSRARVSTPSLSPKRRIDNTSEPTVVIEEMLDDEKKVEIGNVAKCVVSVDNTPSGLDVGEGKTMKRTREDEGGKYLQFLYATKLYRSQKCPIK